MDYRITIAVIAILALLVLAVIFRYRGEGEAEFSITKWLTFRFKGSNKAKRHGETTGVHLEAGTSITANEIVGRDKITHIHASPIEPALPSGIPKLTIGLFLLGPEQAHQQEIGFNQEGHVSQITGDEYRFGIALINHAESSPAKGIDIKVEFFWRGTPPKHSLDFLPPTHPEGWTISVQRLVNEQQAILLFSESERMCFYGHAVAWPGFRVRVQERLDGHLLVRYSISSFQPQTNSSGELRIVFC